MNLLFSCLGLLSAGLRGIPPPRPSHTINVRGSVISSSPIAPRTTQGVGADHTGSRPLFHPQAQSDSSLPTPLLPSFLLPAFYSLVNSFLYLFFFPLYLGSKQIQQPHTALGVENTTVNQTKFYRKERGKAGLCLL